VPGQLEEGLNVLRDENRRLRALVDFSRNVNAERDLRAQLRLLCSELRRATGCTAAAVLLRDSELGGVESIETCGLSLEVDAEWQQAVYAAPAVADVDVQPSGLQRSSVIPLLAGDDLLGFALLFDVVPQRLAEDELGYLSTLADAAAMAILNARLSAQTHYELRRRDALRKVVASISSELDLDSLFGRVIASAVELLDADSGVISVIDRDGTARIRAVHNLPPSVVGTLMLPGDGITGQVLQTREAVIVEHYVDDVSRPVPEVSHVRSGLAVPVWWQGQMIGVFSVFAADPARMFRIQDREVMELLANHVAIALENARL
jgi:GAF domain-containing protein